MRHKSDRFQLRPTAARAIVRDGFDMRYASKSSTIFNGNI